MKNLLRRVARLEREKVCAIKTNPYSDLSDEELDRRLAELRQQLFGDDTAAFEAFLREELSGTNLTYLLNAEEGR